LIIFLIIFLFWKYFFHFENDFQFELFILHISLFHKPQRISLLAFSPPVYFSFGKILEKIVAHENA